jgi:hypothetical protein
VATQCASPPPPRAEEDTPIVQAERCEGLPLNRNQGLFVKNPFRHRDRPIGAVAFSDMGTLAGLAGCGEDGLFGQNHAIREANAAMSTVRSGGSDLGDGTRFFGQSEQGLGCVRVLLLGLDPLPLLLCPCRG